MDDFYNQPDNITQDAFQKYTEIDELKLGAFCVYRHQGKFERARVIGKGSLVRNWFLSFISSYALNSIFQSKIQI